MKKLLLTVASVLTVALAGYSQGTVTMSNVGAGLNAPITGVGGSPNLGSGFWAQLYAGAQGTGASALTAVGSPVEFAAGGFPAGYFNGGTVTIPTIAGGVTATLQVRAWDGSGGNSYEAAVSAGKDAGESATFDTLLGNDTSGPVPTLPATMTGLKSFSLQPGTVIPEPSTIALGLLGLSALLIRRRK